MFITHSESKEIRPGVFVFQDKDTYLSLDDGKRWPDYVTIREPAHIEVQGDVQIEHTYKIQGLMHPKEREETNQMKMSKIWYRSLKVSIFAVDGTWLGSGDPYDPDARRDIPHRNRSCAEMEQYIES